MSIKCPHCGTHRIYFVQNVTEYFIIDYINEEGYFDLGDCVDSYPIGDDESYVECEGCGKYFSIEDIRAAMYPDPEDGIDLNDSDEEIDIQ